MMKNRLAQICLTLAMAAGIMVPLEASASSESDWTISTSITASSLDSSNKLVMNASRCRKLFDNSTNEVSFVFSLPSTVSVSADAVYTLKYARGNESCSKKLESEASDSCITIAEKQHLSQGMNFTVNRKVDTLSSATSADGCENLSEAAYLYLFVSDPVSGFENEYTVTMTLDFRTTRPSAPANVSAEAGGSSLKVSWDSVSDATGYKVYYGAEGVSISAGDYPENLSGFHTASSQSTSITIKDDVSEDTNYLIGVTAFDSYDNESQIGEVVTVETVASDSFWDSYRAENADVDGGFCFIATAAYGSTQEPHVATLRQFRDTVLMQSDAGRAFVKTYYRLSPPLAYFIGQHPTARAIVRAGLWPVYGFAWMLMNHPFALWSILGFMGLGLGALATRRIRRRKAAKAAVPMIAAAIAAGSMMATPEEAYAESPVDMMVEIKAGPYTPDKLGSAFERHFGDKSGFIVEGEYDWQFWRGVGSLGLGLHLAYGNITGHALEEGGEDSVDSTELHWLPLRISLIYRFDYLWTRFSVPLTLYVKAGFDYSFYWIKDGSDSIANADGKKGYGGTFGFHAVAGIAFVLDWLAPEMEKSFDVEWGINTSYIFAEYMYCQLDNFGKSGAFNLTDQATFHIGIGLEF
ncbi:MAG: hypothetical protein IJU23_01510 [Proteobacteria bacterium]|nr:hypothetical protein [Pseudomonadota bacterium]